MIPTDIYNKIILYNSTLLCDLFKSRLKINGLMILFKLQSGKFVRLWHWRQESHGSAWLSAMEKKIKLNKYMCKSSTA